MKIEFEWEKLMVGVLRAKVFGGWIVSSYDSCAETGDVKSQSMVFVPDPSHEWHA